MKKATRLLIFRNGNVAAFGADGRQIPELQLLSVAELWGRYADLLGYDVDGCEVQTQGDGGKCVLSVGVDGVSQDSGEAAKGD